jgi:LacI family transcriptional regulator
MSTPGTQSAVPSQPSAPVRIRDVAAEAGVSVATVSKALNGRRDVSDATRDRVREIAVRLGFQPNQLARSLPTGRSFAVGLLTTDSYGRFSLPLMLGAEDELGSGEIAVMFCDTRDDPEREARQLRALLARQVDGIIVNGRRTEPRPPLRGAGGLPVVYAYAASADTDDCSVVPDDAGGAVLAIEHLTALGRRRIAHITGPRHHRAAATRAEAVVAHLKARGKSVRGRVRFGSWTEAWGREAIGELLRAAGDLDAVFCGSDQIARGVVDGLREHGRQVPDDVAVVGFDNWEAMVLGSRPPLTTIDTRIDQIGRTAAAHLLTMIDGGAPPHLTVVPAALVVRGSA